MTAIDARFTGEPDETSGAIERLAGSFEKRPRLRPDSRGRPKGQARRSGPLRSSGFNAAPVACESLELLEPLEGGPGAWLIEFRELTFRPDAAYMLFIDGVKLRAGECSFGGGAGGMLTATLFTEASPSVGEVAWAEVWAFSKL